ncbi:MAG: uracil-DNA glycosylase family protein [Saprospiraceae bacterium]|nr:uracil-DNA glycosylase family protein [Saprospiraceae bacterium]
MDDILKEIKQCNVCLPHLVYGVNPVLNGSKKSRIAIIGQAPGRLVHASGVPWKDKSGDRLRKWLGVENSSFYNPDHFAIIPMGFCYPGKGKTGDLPPRSECAPLWHKRLFDSMPELKLILLIGSYAQHYYLGKAKKKTLTETVRHFKEYSPKYFPLPHPSPRNNIWMKKNSWFEKEVLPVLKIEVINGLLI